MKRKIAINLILTLLVLISAIIPKTQEVAEANPLFTEYQSVNLPSAVSPIDLILKSDVNYEMRGVWIATVKNLNMKAGMNEKEFTAWAEETVKHLYDNNFNTVIFQVRPTADALYKSEINPWSSFITGKEQGTDPLYDPLKIMVDTSHKYGLEFHAWINPYRVSMPSDDTSKFAKNNVFKTNPDWIVEYDKQYYLNPGIPKVREHLVETVMEIVTNYDIDAVHIDDYFYPYPVANLSYNDEAAFLKYGSDYKNIGDWRRDNVTKLIRDLYTSIKEEKYWVQLGVSPFGVWRNQSSDNSGSNTRAGHESYSSLYADTRQWIKEGIIDYITPQIYWSTEFEIANYNTLLRWWAQEIETHAKTRPVNLYIGLADYKIGTNANNDPRWMAEINEIATQISNNRKNEVVLGQMHFSYNFVRANHKNYMENIRKNLYDTKALTPNFSWLNEAVPKKPSEVTISGDHFSGFTLNIKTEDENTRKFLIYGFYGIPVLTDTDIIHHRVVYNKDGSAVFVDNPLFFGSGSVKIGGDAHNSGYLYNPNTAIFPYAYVIRAVSNSGVLSDEIYVISASATPNR